MNKNEPQTNTDESSLIPTRFTIDIVRLGGDEMEGDSYDYFNISAFSEDEALENIRQAFEILQENIQIISITKYFI